MGKCGAMCIPKRTIYKELTKTIKTRCIKKKVYLIQCPNIQDYDIVYGNTNVCM